MTYEIEKKFRLTSPQALRRRLKSAGIRRVCGGAESNLLLDSGRKLRNHHMTLRLREWCGAGLLTVKGPKRRAGGFFKRLEVQTKVEDAAAMRVLLELLGFKVFARYDKKRDEYRTDGCVVTVDFVPRLKSWFAEIEGTPAAIVRVQRRLGLADASEETRSYMEMILGSKKGKYKC